jgi:hypothetical protein
VEVEVVVVEEEVVEEEEEVRVLAAEVVPVREAAAVPVAGLGSAQATVRRVGLPASRSRSAAGSACPRVVGQGSVQSPRARQFRS